ncbi:MAG: Hpt domain-containing protein [Nautiliaceae bacterium]
MGVQDYLYSEFDSEIVEEFLMLLDSIEDTIDLVIETLYTDKDAINDLFRMFHNLKSATAFLKLKRINNFAHFVEGVLEKYRNGKPVDEKLIDWLFDVAEQFHTWYNDINGNREISPLNPKVLKVPH